MNYELNDNKENIIKLLETNDIDRNKYLLKFLKIMKNNSSHQIFSLNGKWGSGKTIFIKKLVTLIRYCSMYNQGKIIRENVYSQDEIFNEADISNMENILKNSPSYREFNEIVKVDLINCIYFNAWEHDDEDYRDKVPETVIGGNRIYGDIFNYLEDKISLLGSLSDFGERN